MGPRERPCGVRRCSRFRWCGQCGRLRGGHRGALAGTGGSGGTWRSGQHRLIGSTSGVTGLEVSGVRVVRGGTGGGTGSRWNFSGDGGAGAAAVASGEPEAVRALRADSQDGRHGAATAVPVA